MRALRWLPPMAWLAMTACVRPEPQAPRIIEDDVGDRSVTLTPDIDSARELDQAGVRSFREGRYADAIRFFRAAYHKGGPSSELWNIVRCEERLDDAEHAAQVIEEYLAQRDLTPTERAEAERESRALGKRSSLLSVVTVPGGALVTIDGQPTIGLTPLSVDVAPGVHSIVLRREGYATETRSFEARFGKAILVSLDLARPTR